MTGPGAESAQAWIDSLDLNEMAVHGSAKRCGIQWAPWMNDWFTSWSPRNSNSHSEGSWEHWVILALQILQDPLTALVWPEVAEAAKALPEPPYRDAETRRDLSAEELYARFHAAPAEGASE